jgi:hypothetical protein
MPSEPIKLQLPRKLFLGWAMSIASFKGAGIGEIVMTFHAGRLALQSEWGQTEMSYGGEFDGTVRIKGKDLFTLAKRHQRAANLAAPFNLRLEIDAKLVSMDAAGVKGIIVPAKGG